MTLTFDLLTLVSCHLMPRGWSIPVPSFRWIRLTVPELGPFHTDANYSRELFTGMRIHTDASDQVARQNTLTSFLAFITDSVYGFIVFIDLVMLFRRKSHRLDLDMLKRSKR